MHHLERFCSPVAVTGDGGFLVASLESEAAARLESRFVVLIFSDRIYGLIRSAPIMRAEKQPGLVFRARSNEVAE